MIKIITNNVPRDVIQERELSPAEREQFGYVDSEAVEDGRVSRDFVRYHGRLINLSDTDSAYGRMPPDKAFRGWEGYVSDSHFSGLVFRFPREDYTGRDGDPAIDCDRVVVGRYCVVSDPEPLREVNWRQANEPASRARGAAQRGMRPPLRHPGNRQCHDHRPLPVR
jgi:hypothetical protein